MMRQVGRCLSGEKGALHGSPGCIRAANADDIRQRADHSIQAEALSSE